MLLSYSFILTNFNCNQILDSRASSIISVYSYNGVLICDSDSSSIIASSGEITPSLIAYSTNVVIIGSNEGLIVESVQSYILGGCENCIGGVQRSGILGGEYNDIVSSCSSTIIGGRSNLIYPICLAVLHLNKIRLDLMWI